MADATCAAGGPVAEQLLTASEVAGLLRVSRSCVYKMNRLGRLPGILVMEGAMRSCRRWRQSDVLAYLDRQRGAAAEQ